MENSITLAELKTLKIITIAINISVLLFLFLIFGLYFSNSGSNETNTEFINNLLIVLLIVSLSFYIAALFIPKKILIHRLKKSDNYIGSYTTYHIIKLALYEAPALFGLIVILLSILNKTIYSNTYIFVTTFPVFVLVVVSILTFPSPYNVKSIVEKIQQEITI